MNTLCICDEHASADEKKAPHAAKNPSDYVIRIVEYEMRANARDDGFYGYTLAQQAQHTSLSVESCKRARRVLVERAGSGIERIGRGGYRVANINRYRNTLAFRPTLQFMGENVSAQARLVLYAHLDGARKIEGTREFLSSQHIKFVRARTCLPTTSFWKAERELVDALLMTIDANGDRIIHVRESHTRPVQQALPFAENRVCIESQEVCIESQEVCIESPLIIDHLRDIDLPSKTLPPLPAPAPAPAHRLPADVLLIIHRFSDLLHYKLTDDAIERRRAIGTIRKQLAQFGNDAIERAVDIAAAQEWRGQAREFRSPSAVLCARRNALTQALEDQLNGKPRAVYKPPVKASPPPSNAAPIALPTPAITLPHTSPPVPRGEVRKVLASLKPYSPAVAA